MYCEQYRIPMIARTGIHLSSTEKPQFIPNFQRAIHLRALPGKFTIIQALAYIGQRWTQEDIPLNDDGLTLHCLEGLTQTDNTGGNAISNPQVEQKNMIFAMMNKFVKGG